MGKLNWDGRYKTESSIAAAWVAIASYIHTYTNETRPKNSLNLLTPVIPYTYKYEV